MIAALQPAVGKVGGEALPFTEAPVAYRWVQIEPKELRMGLGDFEPFYCQFALYDIAKKARHPTSIPLCSFLSLNT